METMKHVQWWSYLIVSGIILSGCASSRGRYQVPVVDGESAAGRGVYAPYYQRDGHATATVQVPVGGYIVRKGDTLYNIASRYGLTPRELAEMNHLSDPNHIALGQVLRVDRRASTLAKTVEAPIATRTTELQAGNHSGDSASAEAGIEIRPLEPEGSAHVESTKRPSKIPYSDEAWKAAKQKEQLGRTSPADGEKIAIEDPAIKAMHQPDVQMEQMDFSWPTDGRVLQPFGTRNKGVDIGGQMGQPVVASAAGKVVYVGAGLRGYGKLVILKHNKQFLTAYAHNREILVKEGQEVNRGQKIAEMGNTDSDQVKLHFEVRKMGKPVDPIKYLPER